MLWLFIIYKQSSLLDNYLVLLLPFVETGGLEQQTTQPQFTHKHHISAVLKLSLNKSAKCCLCKSVFQF